MAKIYLGTNGCLSAKADNGLLSRNVREYKNFLVDDVYNADVVIYSPCAVTSFAEDDSFSSLYRIRNLMKEDSVLIIYGCLPSISREALDSKFSEVIVKTRDELIRYLEDLN